MVSTMREAARRGTLSPSWPTRVSASAWRSGSSPPLSPRSAPGRCELRARVDAGAVALAATVAAAVAVRRRYPIAALVVLNAVPLVWFLGAYPGRLITLAPLIGCYTLAAYRGWRWGLAGAVLTALIQIIAIRVVLGDTETAGVVPNAVLLAATAGSAGAAVGYYRAVLAATRAQLARETQTREERARRLAAEERLRIARELHDVFGHTMATISVQAGVGLHLIDQRPAHAREALTAIKKICDDGLTDVKTILGILRADAPTWRSEPRGAPGRTRPAHRADRHSRGRGPTGRAGRRRRATAAARTGRPGRLPDHPGGAHQRAAARRCAHRPAGAHSTNRRGC